MPGALLTPAPALVGGNHGNQSPDSHTEVARKLQTDTSPLSHLSTSHQMLNVVKLSV